MIGVYMGLAVIHCYNGERGFIKELYAKYATYVYYPVHLAIICMLL